jgi:hypothetical protein
LLKDIPPIGERFKLSQASKAGDAKEKMQNVKEALQKVRGESKKGPVKSEPVSKTGQKPQEFSDDDEIIDL